MTQTLEPKIASRRSVHIAAAFLVVGTICWGCGFTWAKAGGEAINRLSGAGDGSTLGPMLLLAWRFVAGGIALLLIFPAARRGWNFPELARASILGVLLAAGLILQHLGLDRTSEAVSAFLTSLTILFVPLILTIGLRRPPPVVTWVGVFLATLGVWLMTGGASTGFGVGEVLGLGCSIAFSFYLITVNQLVSPQNVWRMTAGQFIVAGLMAGLVCAATPVGRAALSPAMQCWMISSPDVWVRALLLTALPTVLAFALLNYFQPRLDPTHAALIYLIEPVVATAFAVVTVGRTLTGGTIVGATLILAANVYVSLKSPT